MVLRLHKCGTQTPHREQCTVPSGCVASHVSQYDSGCVHGGPASELGSVGRCVAASVRVVMTKLNAPLIHMNMMRAT